VTRVLLYTGKGGVGKTTSAAATATLAALRGRRTLVLSTDSAHSLSDAFDAGVGGEPTQLDDLLFVQQIDAQRRFDQSWGAVQDYLRSVLRAAGVDPIDAGELTVLPGAGEVLALLEVRDHVRSGRWDVIVVDCAPTAETLRLLALPEALNWYLDRVLTGGSADPAAGGTRAATAGVPVPDDTVFDALRRLQRDLSDIRTLLAGPDASVRLVLTPEAVVVAEARRSLTTLSLYGYRVDGVVANRVFPAAGADNWRRQWVAAQRGILDEVAESFRPLPIWESPYRVCEPVGMEELAAFAVEMYGTSDPFTPADGRDLAVGGPAHRHGRPDVHLDHAAAVGVGSRPGTGPARQRADHHGGLVPAGAGAAGRAVDRPGGECPAGGRAPAGAVRAAGAGGTVRRADSCPVGAGGAAVQPGDGAAVQPSGGSPEQPRHSSDGGQQVSKEPVARSGKRRPNCSPSCSRPPGTPRGRHADEPGAEDPPAAASAPAGNATYRGTRTQTVKPTARPTSRPTRRSGLRARRSRRRGSSW
jgi:arsenite-transporting ATPase